MGKCIFLFLFFFFFTFFNILKVNDNVGRSHLEKPPTAKPVALSPLGEAPAGVVRSSCAAY